MSRWISAALAVVCVLGIVGTRVARSETAEAVDFHQTWLRADGPVRDGAVDRTWIWGPRAYSAVLPEPYAEAPDGVRMVQYFDKSRMELNDPDADAGNPWRVTNGLLVVEMVSGRLQVGDDAFEQRQPAQLNVAGDPDDLNGPTYATFAGLLTAPPAPDGAPLSQRLARDGAVSDDPALAARGVTAAYRVTVPGLDHQVASVFWDFMLSRGLVYENNAYAMASLFPDPFYATGYPISEAYWTTVKVAGTARDVLLQCFERRCLTYTPDNPEGWRVEAGNVGQHYYTWRYSDAARDEYAQRAAAGYNALQAAFYQPDTQLYAETHPEQGDRPYSFSWPFSQAFAATTAVAALAGDGADIGARRAGAEQYWDAGANPPGYASYVLPPLGSGSDKFYDDNAWMGLAFAQVYRQTGDASTLDHARQVFDFVISGWDSDPTHPAPGGVYWTQGNWNGDRNTISNAPSAELALQLAELTDDPAAKQQYIDWALRMVDWVNATLRDPADGLYWDHISLDGQIETTKWSYNQGAMLGAYTLLYRLTGDASYLGQAEAIADAALARFTGDALDAQPAAFNAIFFRNLLMLDRDSHNPAFRAALRAYADRLWDAHRDAASNLATLSKPLTLLDQAALVEVTALVAWDQNEHGPLA